MIKKLADKMKITICCSLIAVVLLLTGCNFKMPSYKKQVFYDFFGTAVLVAIKTDNDFYGTASRDLNACFEEIEITLQSINDKFSTESQDSIIFALNNRPEIKRECDEEFISVFNTAKQIYAETNGLFDPTVKNLVDLWGFSKRYQDNDYQPYYAFDRQRNEDGGFSLPDEKYIEAFKTLTDFNSLSVVDNSISIVKPYLTVDGVNYYQKLDFSGLIKGYATDVVKGVIERYGYTDYYLSAGTSSMYLSSDNQTAITLEITDPTAPEKSFCQVSVMNQFISASGVYENNYTVDGKTYHHIINPKTGKPAETDILSVTLFGDNGAKLDGYSTAVLQVGWNSASEFIQGLGEGISGYIIVRNDKKVMTNMQSVKLLEEGYEIV